MNSFATLADPVRRRIVEVLADGAQAAGALGAVVQGEFGISQPAVSNQLRALREAGVVAVEPRGTQRIYALVPGALDDATAWVERYAALWPQRLDALETELARGRHARAIRTTRIDACGGIGMTVTISGFARALTGSLDRPVVDVERRLALTPAEVWDALVQPERLARWLGTIESGERPRVGDAFGLRLGDEPDDRADCRLLACDAERSLTIAWAWTGEPDSIVRVALEPIDGGTVLRLRHELVASQPVPDYGAGWEAHLDGLGDDLAGLAPRPFAMPAHETWTRMADGVLQVEREMAAPIDAVWAAFASAEGLRTWWWRHWADTTIEVDVRPGGALRIVAPAAGIVLTGEVLTADAAEHHLAATWTWSDADGTSVDEAFDVRLTAVGDGTHVTVRHSGPWADDAPAASYRQGWAFVLGELAAVAAG